MSTNDFQININQSAYGLQSENIPHAFVRSASTSLPLTESPYDGKRVPSFLHFRPLPPNVDVTKIDCHKGDCPRCGTCKAYLSPFVHVDKARRAWRCPMCHRINSTIHFTSIYDMTVDCVDRPELHNLVYDILPPEDLHAKRAIARSYFLLIDEEMLSPENRNTTMEMINACEFGENDIIALITFSGSVTLYDIENTKAVAFPEFCPEFLVNPIKQVKAKENFEKLKACIESSYNSRQRHIANATDAIQWAAHMSDKNGGKIIMMTSGRYEMSTDLVPILTKKVLSLNLFLMEHNKTLENAASHTGGHCYMFDQLSQVSQMRSLFTLPTAWDAATSLRCTADMSKVIQYDGNCTTIDNSFIQHPIIDQSGSITCPISVDPTKASGDFIFQFAFRFTDDNGNRIIRIVNGKMPFSDNLPRPLDEPAIALFYLRHYASENNINEFNDIGKKSRFYMDWTTPNTLFPQLLYGGLYQDKNFLLSTTVEQFALSIIETEIVIKGKKFTVCWRPGFTTVTPTPEQDEMEFFQVAAESLGFPYLRLFIQTEKPVDAGKASVWYSSL